MEHKLWIDGKWVDSKGSGKISVENPATGKKIAEVVDASPEDVNLAVEAAKRAFYDGRWSRLVPSERSKRFGSRLTFSKNIKRNLQNSNRRILASHISSSASART